MRRGVAAAVLGRRFVGGGCFGFDSLTLVTKVYMVTSYSGSSRPVMGPRSDSALRKTMASSLALRSKGACALSKRLVIGTNTALGVRRKIAIMDLCSSGISCVLIRRNTGVGTMKATPSPVIVASRGRRPNT